MQNNRDQLQAYTTVVGRLGSAITAGQSDPPQHPLKRLTTGTVGGIVLGAIGLAGTAAFSLMFPSTGPTEAEWKAPGVLIVDKDTGTRYVFRDDELDPVVNETSARLLTAAATRGGGAAKVVSVPNSSLRDVKHGLPVGIPEAPDVLPDPQRMSSNPWLVCAPAPGKPKDALTVVLPGAAGDKGPAVTAAPPPGPAPTAAATATGSPSTEPPVKSRAQSAVLVRAQDGGLHLVVDGTAHRFGGPGDVLALGYNPDHALPVPDSWLGQLATGSTLAAVPVPGTGGAGPQVNGVTTQIGQIFKLGSADGSATYLVAKSDGLHPITAVQAQLQLGDPTIGAAYPGRRPAPLDLTGSDVARAGISASTVGATDLPAVLPGPGTAAPADHVACLSFSLEPRQVAKPQAVTLPTAALDRALPGKRGSAAVLGAAGVGLLAWLPPSDPASTAPPAEYLITDTGTAYRVADTDTVGALGFSKVPPLAVPKSLLDLLPAGPTIDAAALAGPATG
ncbi:type VII secretion protein EccB [Kitasatospora sp. NPDC093102]|uniref:type VII secretion protein EccB n=1 Tax=Kitasatospora sp. NPDC093102 TaxID=3155069 RepID=UPI003419F81A